MCIKILLILKLILVRSQNMSCQNSSVPSDILQFSSILSLLPGLINTSQTTTRRKCSSYASLVDLSVILSHVFFLVSLCWHVNLRSRVVTFHVHTCQHNGCDRHFSSCLRLRVGEYDISSASTRFLASMLTEGAKVGSSSTCQL